MAVVTPARWLVAILAVAALLAAAVLRRQPMPTADLTPLDWREYERVDGV